MASLGAALALFLLLLYMGAFLIRRWIYAVPQRLSQTTQQERERDEKTRRRIAALETRAYVAERQLADVDTAVGAAAVLLRDLTGATASTGEEETPLRRATAMVRGLHALVLAQQRSVALAAPDMGSRQEDTDARRTVEVLPAPFDRDSGEEMTVVAEPVAGTPAAANGFRLRTAKGTA